MICKVMDSHRIEQIFSHKKTMCGNINSQNGSIFLQSVRERPSTASHPGRRISPRRDGILSGISGHRVLRCSRTGQRPVFIAK